MLCNCIQLILIYYLNLLVYRSSTVLFHAYHRRMLGIFFKALECCKSVCMKNSSSKNMKLNNFERKKNCLQFNIFLQFNIMFGGLEARTNRQQADRKLCWCRICKQTASLINRAVADGKANNVNQLQLFGLKCLPK